MCGRFTLRTPQNLLVQQFLLDTAPPWQPRYNIAPTQGIFTIRRQPPDGQRRADLLRWGLVPSWAEDLAIGNRLLNARAETIADKPSFRAAIKKRRCLIVTDGYYEWQKQGKTKQPYYIRMVDERPFAFAGLWESWHPPQGDVVETCTIITTESNSITRPIHDRMPVILDAADYDRWLDPQYYDREAILQLLVPFDSPLMKLDPVSTHVNSVRHDDPECIVT